ncbi:MAG: hypothetical protein JOZ10_06890, partial [Acidobacteria bacterium]|nr:hypothetical protein [Acidobacteriota bacterium]
MAGTRHARNRKIKKSQNDPGVPSLKIAIQGERGSFSHEAALQMVPSCTVVPCARSAEVFASVLRKRAQAAVIP